MTLLWTSRKGPIWNADKGSVVLWLVETRKIKERFKGRIITMKHKREWHRVQNKQGRLFSFSFENREGSRHFKKDKKDKSPGQRRKKEKI